MDKSHKLFSAQLALLPAGSAAADRRRAVLQDGKRPAANSSASSGTGRVGLLIKASGLLRGKDEGSSRLLRRWGSRCHQSHCYQGNAFIPFLPVRSDTNLGTHLTISCPSAIPTTAALTHALKRREKKEYYLLACWLDRGSIEGSPLLSLPRSK